MTTNALMELADRVQMIADIAEGSGTVNSLPHIAKLATEAATQLRTAASGLGEVHQAYWVLEDVWQDITAEQLAALDETEAVTRTLYLSPPGAEARDAAIKPSSPEIPEGWQLVPMEPTAEMIVAGYAGATCRDELNDPEVIYRDMIQAALRAREVSYPGTGKSEG